MGFFSWLTCDTGESISNVHSCRGAKSVVMVAPDGRRWVENSYGGYGVFGGKDFYELLAELNGGFDRLEGIGLVFKNNPTGNFNSVSDPNLKIPKLFANLDAKFEDSNIYPKPCPDQGYFYEDSDEWDQDDWDQDEWDLDD